MLCLIPKPLFSPSAEPDPPSGHCPKGDSLGRFSFCTAPCRHCLGARGMALGAASLRISIGAVSLAVAVRLFLVGTGPGWTAEDIPDGTGKTVIITGANAGLGYSAAKLLALKGYHVIMGCRSQERGAAALEAIGSLAPKGRTRRDWPAVADLEDRVVDTCCQANRFP